MSFLIIIMENNNTEILSVLNNINENIKLVVEELKKSNDNKMKNTPNLFDLFGGMNSPDEEERMRMKKKMKMKMKMKMKKKKKKQRKKQRKKQKQKQRKKQKQSRSRYN